MLKADFVNSLALECGYFEQQQQADLLATLRTYATVQLRRAERCRRLWERAHAAMLQGTVSDAKLENLRIPEDSPVSTPVSLNLNLLNNEGQFLFNEGTS